ncbi:hypothetical protein [Nocardioides sp.]|uniref:hypothetical protein n=1 Tax=Nocardioides sp. TaxID=35761 RepID=UPI002B268C8D|nr:hypothetical protein [Nocardioides sp.]
MWVPNLVFGPHFLVLVLLVVALTATMQARGRRGDARQVLAPRAGAGTTIVSLPRGRRTAYIVLTVAALATGSVTSYLYWTAPGGEDSFSRDHAILGILVAVGLAAAAASLVPPRLAWWPIVALLVPASAVGLLVLVLLLIPVVAPAVLFVLLVSVVGEQIRTRTRPCHDRAHPTTRSPHAH